MPCRLRRVVPALVAIAVSTGLLSAAETSSTAATAAGASSAATVTVSGPRSSTTYNILFDELQLACDATPLNLRALDPRITEVTYGAGAARIRLSGTSSRSDLESVAERILAAGNVGPVSALVRASGSDERVLLTREVVITCSGDPDAIAARHRCRVAHLITPGVWLLSATSPSLFAGVEAARDLATEPGVTAELQVRRNPAAQRTPTDPLFVRLPNQNDNLPGPNPNPLDNDPPSPPTNYPTDYGPLPWDLDRYISVPGAMGSPPVYNVYSSSLPVYMASVLGDHGQWHLKAAPLGMNCQPVWSAYTGTGVAVTVVDSGVEDKHEDLNGQIRYELGGSRLAGGTAPTDGADFHGTTVSGLIVAIEGNNKGGVGTAFGAKVIPYRYLDHIYDTPGAGINTGPTDDEYAQSVGFRTNGISDSDRTWISNNAWGYGKLGYDAPGTAGLNALKDTTTNGRGTRGTIFVFSAGNDMTPLQYTGLLSEQGLTGNLSYLMIPRDTSDYNGYINRYTMGVGALNRAGHRASYSEIGVNLLVSAPGGDVTFNPYAPNTIPPPYFYPGGMVTTDRSGYPNTNITSGPRNGIDPGIPTSTAWKWAGDYTLVHPYLDPITMSGLWPTGTAFSTEPRELTGTSYAAANVSGVVALMLQARPELTWRDVQHILARRSRKPLEYQEGGLRATIDNSGITSMIQNLGIRTDGWLAAVTPHVVWSPLSPYATGLWFRNNSGMRYNAWYGYGAINATKAVFGDIGGATPSDDTTPLDPNPAELTALKARYDSPGSLHWPLMPVSSKEITATLVYNSAATDYHNGIVPAQALATPGTNTPLIIPFTIDPSDTTGGMPDQTGLVAEAVELHIKLSAESRRGDLAYILVSPKGTITHIDNRMLDNGTGLDYTFTINSLWNEDPAGTWQLFVIDICYPVQNTVVGASLTVHGHLPYPTPTASALSGNGVAAGTSSRIQVTGAGFAQNANHETTMTAGIWYEDPPSSAAPIVQRLAVQYLSDTSVSLAIPASLANASTSPGTARIRIGNPELPLGQHDIALTGASPEDRYQTDLWETTNPAIVYTASATGDIQQRLKMAGGNATPTELTCKYSRPPTITTIADLLLPAGTPPGTTFTRTFKVTDPDINGTINSGRTGLEENLSVTTQVFNQSAVQNSSLTLTNIGLGTPPLYTVDAPTTHGTGDWTLTGTVSGTSGLSLIQVSVTDGVTTTITSFRVGILAADQATGCGGGMGLALLGTPLAVWLLRRRRRN